jgi:hypothetical protein
MDGDCLVAVPDHSNTYKRILYYEIFEMRSLPPQPVTKQI